MARRKANQYSARQRPHSQRTLGSPIRMALTVPCGRSEASVTPHVQSILEHGRRQCIAVVYNGSASQRNVLYWVTPKVAHTKIAKLLRRPPFYPLKLSRDEMYNLNNMSMLDVGRECLDGTCMTSATVLSRILNQKPFEFTFWREPMSHLISAAAQATNCLNTHWCIGRELPWSLQTARDVASLLHTTMADEVPAPIAETNQTPSRQPARRHEKPRETCYQHQRCTYSMPRGMAHSRIVFQRCSSRDRQKGRATLRKCMRHMYPQGAGYGWHPLGVRRLQFVGQMEHFVDEWRRLLRRLGEPEARVQRFGGSQWDRRVVNRRSDLAPALVVGGLERERLAQDATVRAQLNAERCASASLQGLDSR